MPNKIIYIIVAILTCIGCTHRFDGVENNTPVGNMECLWRTLDEKYCFFEEKSVDWQRVHDQYLPAVQALNEKDYLALFDTLESMINVLEDGHVNLYSSFDVSSCKKWYAGYPTNFNWDVIRTNYLIDYRTAGGAYYGIISSDSIGYIYINSFENAVSPSNMAYILRSFINCRGLIVDVRNNGGGNLSYAYQLAATFFSESQTVGYWQHKNGVHHNDFSPMEEQRLNKDDMPSSWLRPVTVLCNRRTYSAANFFVSIMRYAQRSAIVGDRSGGGGGMPLSYELPNGWLIRFSSIRMMDREQKSIENGILPQIKVDDNEQTTDKDEIIEAGIDWINSNYKHDTSN